MASLGQVVAGGGLARQEGEAGWAGWGRKRISYPVTRAYTHEILLFSYFPRDKESISGPHFSSF